MVSAKPAPDQSKLTPFPVGLLAGILIVVTIYFGSMLAGQAILSFAPLAVGWSPSRISDWIANAPLAQFLYIVVVEALTLRLLFVIMSGLKVSRQMIGLIRPRLRDFGVTLLAYPPYFVVNAAAALAATAVFHLNTDQRQQTGFESVTGSAQLVMTFISLVILPPIVEEIVMRGFLFSSLKSRLRVLPASLLTSLIFAAAHLQFGSGAPLLWLAAIDTFILSLVLCYIRQKTGSLWAGIGLHMLKNLIAFLALFVFPNLPSAL